MENFDFNKTLYKYRGFSNFEFALDIFLNERLYAADFKTLNDPMEGRFRYSRGRYSKDEIRSIVHEKAEYKILSLSELWNNHLLWSYYAEGHSGFVVGVQIVPNNNIKVKKINYVDNFHLEEVNPESIFSMKHSSWEHENEFRVLQYNYANTLQFVDVRIKELIIGKNAYRDNKLKVDLLKSLVSKLMPDVEVKELDSAEIKEWID